MLESVKESGYVSKCNPTGEFSLKSIKMIFNPVQQSSPPVQSSDCRLPTAGANRSTYLQDQTWVTEKVLWFNGFVHALVQWCSST